MDICHKPPSGDVHNLLAIPFRREYRDVEFILELGPVVDVDEAETAQGPPVVRANPVTEVRSVRVRRGERPIDSCFAVVANAFNIANSQWVPAPSRVWRFETRQAEEHLQVTEHRRVYPAAAVADCDAHRERDFLETVRPGEDREHGKELTLPSRSHATPPEQVCKGVFAEPERLGH